MTSSKPLFTRALAFAAALTAAASAHAQSFDVQQLRLRPNQQDNYFGQHSARLLPGGSFEAGLVLHYANDPLVIVDEDGERVGSLVRDQVTGNVLFAWGVLDRLELGLDLPLVLAQRGDRIAEVADSDIDRDFGVGDLHATAKISFWQTDTRESPGGTAMALALDAQFPTGSEDDFQGEGLRLEPRLVFDYAFPRSLRLSAQVGYLVRPQAELLDTEVDDTLTFGLGADLPLDRAQRLHLIAEGDGKVSVLADDLDSQEIPIEALLGARVYTDAGVMIEAGGGFGVNPGFGTPDYRLIGGITYRPPHDPDPDRDGVLEDSDRCPNDPEDRDSFEDEDGCPDPDNDKDGVLDISDKCPNDPEDRDGFEDQDGCADPDNDRDGLLDAVDKCPNDPEDTDDFEDEDGCADPDNDKDGVPDGADACPNDAEDKDGFEDDNGCPDPDNDKDGLLDPKDNCPDQAEDFDGFEDEDGCAEAGTGLVKLTCDKVEIADRVYFDTGKDTIQARSFALLDQVAGVLKSASHVKKVRVEGHTDDRGNDKYNLELSTRRAASVVRYLAARGVAEDRLTSRGFGETTPIASNKTSAGRGQNRRVEFVITEQESDCAKP